MEKYFIGCSRNPFFVDQLLWFANFIGCSRNPFFVDQLLWFANLFFLSGCQGLHRVLTDKQLGLWPFQSHLISERKSRQCTPSVLMLVFISYFRFICSRSLLPTCLHWPYDKFYRLSNKSFPFFEYDMVHISWKSCSRQRFPSLVVRLRKQSAAGSAGQPILSSAVNKQEWRQPSTKSGCPDKAIEMRRAGRSPWKP